MALVLVRNLARQASSPGPPIVGGRKSRAPPTRSRNAAEQGAGDGTAGRRAVLGAPIPATTGWADAVSAGAATAVLWELCANRAPTGAVRKIIMLAASRREQFHHRM